MSEYEQFQALLERDYGRQFAAAERLLDFVQKHPTASGRVDDPAPFVVWATCARSIKTFRATLILCRQGYGEQASMLARALFEDMVIAHWVAANGLPAAEQLGRHHELVVDNYRRALLEHGRAEEAQALPELPSKRRKELEDEFGAFGQWLGRRRGIHQLLGEIEDRWSEPEERPLLRRIYALAHQYNTLLLHHSVNALNQTVTRNDAGAVAFTVGPSDRNVGEALFAAYYAFEQLCLLAYESIEAHVELKTLVAEDMRVFTRVPPGSAGRNDPCPCGSGRKYKHCHGA